MPTVEQQIITAIDGLLKGITPGNGYDWDASAAVYEWRVVPQTGADLPAIVYQGRELRAPVEDDERRRELIVDIAMLDDGAASAASVRDKKQDILTALSALEEESVVLGARFLGSRANVEHNRLRVADELISISVEYYASDPWTI